MTIDQSIEHVERLFTAVTGRSAPELQGIYAPLNPDVDPVIHLERRIEELVTLLQNPAVIPPVRVWSPQLSIWENEREIMIKIDLAGVKKEDVDISIRGNVLFVTGTRKPRAADAGYTLRVTEKAIGPFQREVILPLGVLTARLHSQMVDGVLEIQIPKESDSKALAKTGKH
ncbi:MAG: Hsp20/alpha crystallin family protein [Bdellovibrionales bacterium]|nr:Hsp20/alpha crystallin family protein [Bdellovibrionales bacterium]